jgi:colicin import membrane protein
MTHVLVKKPQAASPWMLAISVALHGLFFALVIILSATFAKKLAPIEQISSVKLVAAPASAAAMEKIEQSPPAVVAEVPSAELEQTPVTADRPDPPREAIEARAMRPPAKDIIPLKKRKSQPQRVEAAKKPEKKAKEEPAPKEPSAENHLQKRLASISKEVERRKKEALAQSQRGPGGVTGSQGGGGVVDEELVRWLEGVRNRINSHWSILGDQRNLQRVTVIGVKIAENGRLLDASVHNSSGDDVFDGSALRAVFQADPFPRVPSQVMERIQKAGGLALRFTPGGVQ